MASARSGRSPAASTSSSRVAMLTFNLAIVFPLLLDASK
jgi:hypothetical protein